MLSCWWFLGSRAAVQHSMRREVWQCCSQRLFFEIKIRMRVTLWSLRCYEKIIWTVLPLRLHWFFWSCPLASYGSVRHFWWRQQQRLSGNPLAETPLTVEASSSLSWLEGGCLLNFLHFPPFPNRHSSWLQKCHPKKHPASSSDQIQQQQYTHPVSYGL